MQKEKTLNPYQLAAVTDEHMTCLVKAHVGSGKTTVLMEKIFYLHKEKKIPLSDMIVLTFTNKAANEIKNRLQEESKDLFFGTFHSIAMQLLQKKLPVEELGFDKNFQVCLPDEEQELARSLIDVYGLKIKYKNRLKKRIETYYEKNGKNYDDDISILMQKLLQEKINQNKMTYQELIANAVRLLKRYPEIKRPKWLIVDEVQDCDDLQLDFLDALRGDETRLFAVGDPNQVIYGWRGSTFAVFYRLKERYQATEYTLPVNYRSSMTILKAAGRFLQSGTPLLGMGEEGEKVRICKHYDPFGEAQYLADKLYQLHEEGISYNQIGIFYRLQKQSSILQQVLSHCGIPFETSEKMSFFEIPVIRWLYDVCKYIVNDTDYCALQRILTDKKYGDNLTEAAFRKNMEKEDFSDITFMKSIFKLFQDGRMEEVISDNWVQEFREILGVKERIGRTNALFEEEMEQANFFFDRFLLFANNRGEETALTVLKNFLNEAALYGMNVEKEENLKKTEAVSLLTLHASKGLEFSHVFIIGVNQGLIPLGNTKKEEEEEQRLFFVGMTRAKQYLELSYYGSRPYPGVLPGPSTFLRMIRSEVLEEPLIADKSRDEAAAHLQKMKRMILKERRKEERPNKGKEESVQENEKGKENQHLVYRDNGNMSEKDRILKEEISKEPDLSIRIHHEKYGEGYLIKEDDTMFYFMFDDYGEKEMLKMFTNFTRIIK